MLVKEARERIVEIGTADFKVRQINATVVPVKSSDEGFAALIAGRVDALAKKGPCSSYFPPSPPF